MIANQEGEEAHQNTVIYHRKRAVHLPVALLAKQT
jgi:hypothetical protein